MTMNIITSQLAKKLQKDNKLLKFNIVNPTHAVFDQKDAQQLIIIKQMIHNKNCPIEMLEGPIIRDNNGLALSSRNDYLSNDNKKASAAISKSFKSILLSILISSL